ncbi:ion transporter [Mycolicibacterium sphagni]|uniref:ion transporter n=1 Tax=Mycolicibacterium sphagni TaxID=1786 RepID=UPI0021F34246|nr:ion transporter [Mycolicibacterium sphagni]MCV7174817.1 ion transporter [Mycolicibacterium sphagni]
MRHVVTTVIVANTAALGYGLAFGEGEWLEWAHVGFTVFFVGELFIRWRRARGRGWRDGWLLFDTAVVAIGVLPIVAGDSTLLRSLRIARLARFARLAHGVRALRHVSLLRMVDVLRRSA